MSGVWKTLACGKLKLHFKVTAGSDSSNWKTYVLFWYSYLWLLICLLAEKCTLVFVVAVLVIFVGGGGGGGGGGVCVCACVCARARAPVLFLFVLFCLFLLSHVYKGDKWRISWLRKSHVKTGFFLHTSLKARSVQLSTTKTGATGPARVHEKGDVVQIRSRFDDLDLILRSQVYQKQRLKFVVFRFFCS